MVRFGEKYALLLMGSSNLSITIHPCRKNKKALLFGVLESSAQQRVEFLDMEGFSLSRLYFQAVFFAEAH